MQQIFLRYVYNGCLKSWQLDFQQDMALNFTKMASTAFFSFATTTLDMDRLNNLSELYKGSQPPEWLLAAQLNLTLLWWISRNTF